MRIFSLTKVAVVGFGAAAALMLTPTATLAASAGAAAAEGSGTISPALTTANQAVTGGFTGTLVGAGVAGTAQAVQDTCTFTFASTAPGDSVATGQGTSSGNCSGNVPITASLGYTRVGSVVVLTGTGTVNGIATGVDSACVFVPTSNPVGTFLLACAVVNAGTA